MNEIIIKNLSKTINKNIILNNINIELHGGKIYGLSGQNGSGKTMLIRTIAGLMKPTSGTIKYNGKLIYKEMDFIPELGMIIENIEMYPEFTGYKNLELLAKIRGKCNKTNIENMMNIMGLSADDKRKVKKYSLGMKQKLAIIQAFMENPNVILLDEPTNALDELSIKKFQKMCLDFAKQNAIIVIASHDKELISELCDITFKIRNGEIIDKVVKE